MAKWKSEQVVVVESVGEGIELVVAVEGVERIVLQPPDLVDKTAGSADSLTTNRIQFTERAASATAFNTKHVARTGVKALRKREGRNWGRMPAGRCHTPAATSS